MKHRATIHDVAREAGCSTASVSRALNGDARVSPGLVDRVRAAAARLDFRINAIGRALQTRRSGVVGVMIPSIANPVFAEAVAGAGDVAAGRGRQLLLASSDYDPQKELEAVATLIDRSVDGLLLTVADADDSPALEAALAADVPTVLMFNGACARAPVATSDAYAAGAAVGKLLVEAARRHVGFVAGRFATSDRSRRRFEGLRICYNCPPQWADWASMLKAIEENLGIKMPHDNKNSGQTLSQLLAEKDSPGGRHRLLWRDLRHQGGQ
jgi:DNA-binding LacI/PurR family transcriptional regulator